MSLVGSHFYQVKQKQKPRPYYIVKDDFIINLRKENNLITKSREDTECRQPTTLQASSLLIEKKKEVSLKLKCRANNNFYELQKQIDGNKKTIYRKLIASLRKTKNDCSFKLSNPFQISQNSFSKSVQKIDKDRNLLQLIVQVQPYWIKKYIGRPTRQLQ